MYSSSLINFHLIYLTPLDTEAVVQLDQGHNVAVSPAEEARSSGAEDEAGGGVLPDLGHLARALDVEGLLRDQIPVTVQSPHCRFALVSNEHKTFKKNVTLIVTLNDSTN